MKPGLGHRGVKRIVCFGEAMAELADLSAGRVAIGVGGDTFNTAVYLARQDLPVSFASVLGADPLSRRIRDRLALERIDHSLTLEEPRRACGLYAIEVDERGERSFTYWRDSSAVRSFFHCEDTPSVMDAMEAADILYLSGISLSLFRGDDRRQLLDLVRSVKTRGGEVVFDTNYRPAGWDSALEARSTIECFAPYITVSLPTFEDESALFGFSNIDECADFWTGAGAREIVIKSGPDGAYCPETGWVPPARIIEPVDTTGAGDSFNGGYLAARCKGASIREAIESAHALAGQVLNVRGALLPLKQTVPV